MICIFPDASFEEPSSGRPFSWALAIGLALFGLLCGWLTLHAFVGMLAWFGGEGFSTSWAWASQRLEVLSAVQAVAVGCVVWVARKWAAPRTNWFQFLWLKTITWRTCAWALIAGCSWQFVLSELGNLLAMIFPNSPMLGPVLQKALLQETLLAQISVWVAVALIPPLSEELFFRGLLLPQLAARYGKHQALCFTSALFGISHGSLIAALCALVAGFMLGAAALGTRSTLTSIAIHICFNAAPLVLTVAQIRIQGFNTFSATPEHLHPLLFSGSLLLAVLSLQQLLRPSRNPSN